jgi:hypothetical protein
VLPSPQAAPTVTGPLSNATPFPMQPIQAPTPARAVMVKVLEPVPVSGPSIVT